MCIFCSPSTKCCCWFSWLWEGARASVICRMKTRTTTSQVIKSIEHWRRTAPASGRGEILAPAPGRFCVFRKSKLPPLVGLGALGAFVHDLPGLVRSQETAHLGAAFFEVFVVIE